MSALTQTLIHYSLHLGFPLLIALVFFRGTWKRAYLIFLLTMLVDLDHLLANPIFQADRCSINFHPLHTFYAMLGYAVMLFFRGTYRLLGVGLLFHMLTDFIDCLCTFSRCADCLKDSPIYGFLSNL